MTDKKSVPITAKEKARRLFVAGDRIATIALKVGKSRRTVERWAADGAWEEARRADPAFIEDLKERQIKIEESKEARYAAVSRRDRESVACINTAIEIVMTAIESLDAKPKSLEGCITAMAKLLELREKLQPKTASDLARVAIELGLKPEDFATELREQWDRISA